MIDIPVRMEHLPRRGRYVVGYMFGVDDKGVPDFTVLDDVKIIECVTKHRCGLCGRELDYWIAFVGGPLSVKNRAFSDPPMHEECARYALSVCPFLLGQSGYAKRDAREGLERGHNPAMTYVQPERFALYVCRDFTLTKDYIKAGKAKRVEWMTKIERTNDRPSVSLNRAE